MGAFHIFSGNEDFSIKERANEFMRELCGELPEENPSLEIIRGDTEGEKGQDVIDRLMESLATPSFLCPEKIIWIKHFNKIEDLTSEPNTKKKQSRLEIFSQFLKAGIPDDVTLILDGPLDRRTSFYKLCDKTATASGGKSEWFEKADTKSKGAQESLSARIREMALNSGKHMHGDAAAYLAETVGSDIARLTNEVAKLVAYAGDNRAITLQDCFEVSSRGVETLSWMFASALVERNAAHALELIPGILETMGTGAEIAIAGMVHNEFQRLLAIRCEAEKFGIPRSASYSTFQNLNPALKEQYPNSVLLSMHPFRAFKIWENTRRFTDVELADAFQAILDASRGMVTGRDPRVELETLVLKIAGGAA